MTRLFHLRNIFLVGIFAVFMGLFNINKAKAQNDYVDFDVFYNELAPYGNWYTDPEYGYVWQPRVVNNFQPYYTNGYWVMTEYGNTWISNYAWGWAPFHYGRWTMTRIGWVWIPGNEWGPAWVDWRHGNGYYGWAPMGPSININININRWNTPADWFVFVPQAHIYNRFTSGYRRPSNYMDIYNKTIIVNNYYYGSNNRPVYNYGPRRDDIARYTNRNVNEYRLTNSTTRRATVSARGNEVSMYRPAVRNTNKNAAPRTTAGNIREMSSSAATKNNATSSRQVNTSNSRSVNTSSTSSRSSSVNTTTRNITPASSSSIRSNEISSTSRSQNVTNSNSRSSSNTNVGNRASSPSTSSSSRSSSVSTQRGSSVAPVSSNRSSSMSSRSDNGSSSSSSTRTSGGARSSNGTSSSSRTTR